MSDIVIKVENLTKIYHLYNKHIDILKEVLHPFRKKYHHDFYALKDVSFEIKKGETVGIIGKNGAGKSTLLKILTGVLTQSSGNIYVDGKVASLLELGTGFHPDLTGRENIFFNGTINGFSDAYIKSKLDSIINFADIGEFIDQPLRVYSSGMYVRLAFSLNVMLEPEIMIIDEALSVGDINFQVKCMTMINKIKEKGSTILFVSHDIGTVRSLCSRGIYLEHGEIKALGSAPDVAELYIRDVREAMNAEHKRFARKPQGFEPINNEIDEKSDGIVAKKEEFRTSEEFDKRVSHTRYGTGEAKVTYVEFLNSYNEPVNTVEFDQEISIKIYFESFVEEELTIIYYVLDQKRNFILGSGPLLSGYNLPKIRKKKYVVTYKTKLPLMEGIYSIDIEINRPVIPNETVDFLDVVSNAVVFRMERRIHYRIWSNVYIPNKYSIIEI
ncbi:MAG: ABC transporter ATP-binding protein [Lentisphaerota bacterium]